MINGSHNWIIEIFIRHCYSLDGERLAVIDKAQSTFDLLNDRVNDLGRYKWRLELEVD